MSKVTTSTSVFSKELSLVNVRLAFGTSQTVTISTEEETCTKQSLDLEQLSISEKMSCGMCALTFNERTEQVRHFRSDWHRFNLKQKIRGIKSVTEESFHNMTDDVSSISGSESDSDEHASSETDVTSDQAFNVCDTDDTESYHVEGVGRRHPRVFLRNDDNELFSIYRAVLYSKKNQPENEEDLLSRVTTLPTQQNWLILMLAGGHFAGAVFHGDKPVCHKTFHRYVVRAKRGTVQSARDGQGNAPKSVGAYLRRHHEAALNDDIKSLLTDWSEHLTSCHRIFLRATGSARQTFFNAKAPLLDKHDPRLRLIPFPTRRPTFKELNGVWTELSTVKYYDPETVLSEHISSPAASPRKNTSAMKDMPNRVSKNSPRQESVTDRVTKATGYQEEPHSMVGDVSSDSDAVIELQATNSVLDTSALETFEHTKRPRRKKKKTVAADSLQERVDDDGASAEEVVDPYKDIDVFCGLKNQLYTAVKTGDVTSLEELLQEWCDSADKIAIPRDVCINYRLNDAGATLLHLACTETQSACIFPLLQNGASPVIKNSLGQVPYLATKDKQVRNEFRRFRAQFPKRYDYTAGCVPAPLSEEREHEKRTKEAERRKALKKAKTARLKEQKEAEGKVKKELEERERFLALSDREKRALAAERRLQSQAEQQGTSSTTRSRCYQCALDITGKVPFEYEEFKFCTPKCLQTHRKTRQRAPKAQTK